MYTVLFVYREYGLCCLFVLVIVIVMIDRNTCMVSSLHHERPTNTRVMDRIPSGYTADTDVYEYRGENFLDNDAQGTLFRPASSSSDSDQLSLQGIGSSQQSSLPQNFYRACSQRSSLTSSSQGPGVGVSAIFLPVRVKVLTGFWRRIMGFCINRYAGVSHSFCPLTGEIPVYVCLVVFRSITECTIRRALVLR